MKWTKEHSLSTGNYCRHAPLKELVLRGSLEGTTPLLLACSHGDLEMAKSDVEFLLRGDAAGIVLREGKRSEVPFFSTSTISTSTF